MKPEEIEKAIHCWALRTNHNFSYQELGSLIASIFNAFQSDGNVHMMPDDFTHLESKLCYCNPVLSYKDEKGIEHWVHNNTREGALN